MNRIIRILMLTLASVAIRSSVTQAGIIVDQPPDLTGGPYSDTDYFNSLGQPRWQREADNILLSQDADLRRLTYFGFYGGSGTPATPPPLTEQFQVRFMGARTGDGLPDEGVVLFDQTYPNPSRTPTGRILAVGGLPFEQVYQIDFPKPIHLQAGTPYWLEIVQLGDLNSGFRWEAAAGIVPNHAFINPLTPGWFASEGGLAFQLTDIPEPATALGTILATIVFARSSYHRRRWHNYHGPMFKTTGILGEDEK